MPKAWPTGSVKGLRARSGFTVDIQWKDGKVASYRIASAEPRKVKVRIRGETKTIQAEKLREDLSHDKETASRRGLALAAP